MARQRSLRLRTRVTLFFAFIALFAGSVLIGVTYGFARSTLLERESSTARDQTIIHADLIRQQLEENPQTINVFVDKELRFRIDDDGFANLGSLDPARPRAGTDTQRRIDDYPEVIVNAVEQRGNGTAYVGIDGQNYVVVGVYIGAFDVGYYEAFPLGDTERTLRAIFTALALGGIGTLVLATLFGF